MIHLRPRFVAGAGIAALTVSLLGASGVQAKVPRTDTPVSAPFSGRVAVSGHRRLFLECRGQGRPTVILESGLGNAGDVWTGPFLHAADPAADPRSAVVPSVARSARVCAYDRPGTGRLDTSTGAFLPSRSDPVAMPRTGLDIVRDLRALLHRAPRAAGIRPPYLLVGHSFGGLTQRLYATMYPGEVAGLVLVDPTPPLYASVLDRLLAAGLLTAEQYATVATPPVPPGLEGYAAYERIAIDASGAQIVQAQADTPLPPTRLVFLTLPGVTLPPDWSAAAVDAVQGVYAAAQKELAALVPGARQVVVADSSHYIQLDRPALVTDAIHRIIEQVRGARSPRRAP